MESRQEENLPMDVVRQVAEILGYGLQFEQEVIPDGEEDGWGVYRPGRVVSVLSRTTTPQDVQDLLDALRALKAKGGPAKGGFIAHPNCRCPMFEPDPAIIHGPWIIRAEYPSPVAIRLGDEITEDGRKIGYALENFEDLGGGYWRGLVSLFPGEYVEPGPVRADPLMADPMFKEFVENWSREFRLGWPGLFGPVVAVKAGEDLKAGQFVTIEPDPEPKVPMDFPITAEAERILARFGYGPDGKRFDPSVEHPNPVVTSTISMVKEHIAKYGPAAPLDFSTLDLMAERARETANKAFVPSVGSEVGADPDKAAKAKDAPPAWDYPPQVIDLSRGVIKSFYFREPRDRPYGDRSANIEIQLPCVEWEVANVIRQAMEGTPKYKVDVILTRVDE